MNRRILLPTAFLIVMASLPRNAAAQEPHHPQISLVHKGLGDLKKDIKLMLDLATDDQRHYDNWAGVIDLFAYGLDMEKPFRIDLLIGLTPPPVMIYGPFVPPYTDIITDNLEPAEYVLKKQTDTLYELLPPDRGWFRALPQQKYAILTLSEKATHDLLKQLILKAGSPLPVIGQVLTDGVNAGLQLVNEAPGVEDQKKRRASFAQVRANQMDALQKRPQESRSEFELRKGLMAVYHDELERIIVESAKARLLAFLNHKDLDLKLLIDWTAIADTSLAWIYDAYGKEEDAFASVKKADGSALSFRMNHPLDELRQKDAEKIMALIKADVLSRMDDAESKMTSDQKRATEQLVDGIIQLIKDGNSTGNINAFMESVPNKNGDFVSWGATIAKDAKRLDTTLALIPKTSDGNEVELKLATVNGVDIHRIKLKKDFVKAFDQVFGQNADVFIGTSENMVWFSAGPDSLPSLKKAIEGLGKPEHSDNILKVDLELLPWAKRAEKIVKAMAEPSDPDQKETRRNVLLTLKQATEALKETDDDVHFNMAAKDGTATGILDMKTGLLRFVGTQLEKVSKNILE